MIEVRSLLRRLRCVAWPPALRPVVRPLLPSPAGARALVRSRSRSRARAWRGGGEECEGEERSVLVIFLLLFPSASLSSLFPLLVFFSPFFSRLFSWMFFTLLY